MRIAIFGATGRVGSRVMEKALQQGIEVRALVRTPEKVTPHEGLEVIQGDATNLADIQLTIQGCSKVFSGLSTDKSTTLSLAIPLIVKSMEESGLQRIVTIGTAGILNSRSEPDKYRFETSESKRKKTFAAEEHLDAYYTLSKSSLDWTIICPTYLPDGEEQEVIRFEKDLLPEEGKKITVGDTATFAFKELLYNNFINTRVGICY